MTAYTVQGSWREQAGRPFRFFRVFRVVRFLPSLQMLCDQMVLAIPSMLSIIGLMMIWVFVYAGIGTQVGMKQGGVLDRSHPPVLTRALMRLLTRPHAHALTPSPTPSS